MKTRVRTEDKDEDRLTGNMAWAEYLHFTNRPTKETDFGFEAAYSGEELKTSAETLAGNSDPHLHAHCVAFNLTCDPVERRFKAGQFGDLKRDGYYYEDAFHARFARRLNELLYATEKKGNSFTLAAAPQSLTDKFSRRRNEIEKDAKAKGITDAKGKHEIARKGRRKKSHAKNRSELRRLWDTVLSPDERAYLADMIHGRIERPAQRSLEESGLYALGHIFERYSTAPEKRVLAEALSYGVGSVLPEQVKAWMAGRKDAIRVHWDGQDRLTTKAVLDEEIAMLEFARQGHGQYPAFGYGGYELSGLSGEQLDAAMHVLDSRDRVVGIRGAAGAGKTRTLKAIKHAIESGGNRPGGRYSRVYAFAPSSQASRGVLQAEGFNSADTLKRLLVDEKLQALVRDQVLLIDEAGLTGTKQIREVFALAANLNARIVAVGDYNQNSSVERGDAFRLLESEAGVKFAHLTEIRRQTHAGYKKIAETISKGTAKGAQKGFDALDKLGWIVEKDGEERHQALVSDYLKAVDEHKSSLIIAPTHREGERLTLELRATLRERGAIGSEERAFITRRAIKWTDAEKGDAGNYEPGMVVEFHKDVRGVRKRKNGQRVTERGFGHGESVLVKAVDGQGVLLLRRDGSEAILPLDKAGRFQVYRPQETVIAKGDRIRNTKNGLMKLKGQARGTRVNNGDTVTVEGFTKEGDIRLPGGKIMPKDWGHFTHGYVDTSYASQGKTVDRVFVGVGNESLAATGRQQWYVSLTRGREMAKVYVDSKEDVREAIARGGERMSAVELIKHQAPKPLKPWHQRFYESVMERSRSWRFLKARAAAIAGGLRIRPGRKGPQRGGISYA